MRKTEKDKVKQRVLIQKRDPRFRENQIYFILVYQFLAAAITNHCKLGTTHIYYLLVLEVRSPKSFSFN